jgi:hypothetical protein
VAGSVGAVVGGAQVVVVPVECVFCPLAQGGGGRVPAAEGEPHRYRQPGALLAGQLVAVVEGGDQQQDHRRGLAGAGLAEDDQSAVRQPQVDLLV